MMNEKPFYGRKGRKNFKLSRVKRNQRILVSREPMPEGEYIALTGKTKDELFFERVLELVRKEMKNQGIQI